jgi:hypothetical protein
LILPALNGVINAVNDPLNIACSGNLGAPTKAHRFSCLFS